MVITNPPRIAPVAVPAAVEVPAAAPINVRRIAPAAVPVAVRAPAARPAPAAAPPLPAPLPLRRRRPPTLPLRIKLQNLHSYGRLFARGSVSVKYMLIKAPRSTRTINELKALVAAEWERQVLPLVDWDAMWRRRCVIAVGSWEVPTVVYRGGRDVDVRAGMGVRGEGAAGRVEVG